MQSNIDLVGKSSLKANENDHTAQPDPPLKPMPMPRIKPTTDVPPVPMPRIKPDETVKTENKTLSEQKF